MTAMQVETFEVTEIDSEGQPECEAEALALIEQLGLAGQKKLVSKSDAGDAVRCPYRKMTLDERHVYNAICPKVTKLKDFADSPIPVRVLQVASHAKDIFDEIFVWSATDADIKDPVLVGRNSPTSYSHEYFILARWGEVLEPFDKLLKMAADMCRAKRKTALQKALSECQAKLSVCDSMDDHTAIKEDEDPKLSDNGRSVSFL